MHSTSHTFKSNAREALNNDQLQDNFRLAGGSFADKRAEARSRLPEFDDLRDQAHDIKNHVLAHLDIYLESFEDNVRNAGGHVHWAQTSDEACSIVREICAENNARLVTKGKSMISEEIGLNGFLESQGIEVAETDLGEYIIQIRNESPSHIIAPAIHLSKNQIRNDFRERHSEFPPDRPLEDAGDFVAEARAVLRKKFLAADVGITGANFLVAETGSTVIVTNEGNGDLTQSLAKTHIVLASIEKIVPTLEDVSTFLRVLARSATGQEISTYTTFSTGPRRSGDPDGPAAFHVILLDNGRSKMLGGEFQDMLRCIRCGACMNHCPVYQAIGGHAYGWVYPGPMGAVLTPSLIGIDAAGHLPNASTFCGRCEAVCPVRIPLPKMMRHWREREYHRGKTSSLNRLALRSWAYLAKRPNLYRRAVNLPIRILHYMGGKSGVIRSFSLFKHWTKHKDIPAPQKKTFLQLWAEQESRRKS
ncbi:MAG: LutB/LldF family L-lactate oxidation iron-sulfur protein [Methyloligellaceae bacterium]